MFSTWVQQHTAILVYGALYTATVLPGQRKNAGIYIWRGSATHPLIREGGYLEVYLAFNIAFQKCLKAFNHVK